MRKILTILIFASIFSADFIHAEKRGVMQITFHQRGHLNFNPAQEKINKTSDKITWNRRGQSIEKEYKSTSPVRRVFRVEGNSKIKVNYYPPVALADDRSE